MIIRAEKNIKNIVDGPESIIVFAINKEGINENGFAGSIATTLWPELYKLGGNLGSVYSKTCDNKTYYAIVCHSLENGWGTPEEQTDTIKKCFDKIEQKEGDTIATVAIGTGRVGLSQGADKVAITRGMVLSKRLITYYGDVPEEIIKYQFDRLKAKELAIRKIIDVMETNFNSFGKEDDGTKRR